jgi:four helix bundle protein
MQDFRNLKVWQKSHALVLAMYKLSRGMPREEQYGMVAALRRTAMAIPLKIAEACGQQGDEDFRRQVWLANASARELDYALLLARDLQYIDVPAYDSHLPLVVEVQKMLYALSQARPGQ